MKYLNKILAFLVLLLGTFSFSQTVTVSPTQCTVYPGGIVNDCGTINIASNNSVSVQFQINLSKPNGLVVGTSTAYIYSQRTPTSPLVILSQQNNIQENFWNEPGGSYPDTYSLSGSVTLNASDFDVSGGILYVAFVSNGNIEYDSCPYQIIKNQTPTFILAPTTTSVACGSTATYSFTVANLYNSPGTLTYQWNVGSSWSGTVNSSMSSIILTPSSLTTLPSSVTVTPYLNGVAQPTKTCPVTRAPFSSSAAITGTTGICSGTATYPISGVLAGQTVTWSLSNPSIGTLSSSSNSQTNVTFNGNGAQTLNATITNACGQTVTRAYVINTGATTFTSTATITGTNNSCSGSGIYTISGLLTGQTVTWSLINSPATLSGSTNTQTTVTITGNGLVTLNVVVANSCGQSDTKTITFWAGKPSIRISQPATSTCNTMLQIGSANPNVSLADQGINTITWLCDGEQSIGSLNYSFQSYSPITLSATNACGTTTLSPYVPLKLPAKCGSFAQRMSNSNTNNTTVYEIYPNPSKDIVNIDLRDQNSQPVREAIISGELFDMSGQSKSKVEIKDNKATFSVRGLIKGIYVLKIYIDDQIETHQIVVE